MGCIGSEIRKCLCANLHKELDPCLAKLGIVRPTKTLIYRRELAQAVQKVETVVEIHPADRPESAAAVYPWLDVTIPAVEKIFLNFAETDALWPAGLAGVTLREPIEFTSAKAMQARWFIFQPDSVPAVVSGLKSFLLRWTIPFLDEYATTVDVCEAYDRGDPRVTNDRTHRLHVVAAMLLSGRKMDAVKIMERWFGKPGLRKYYTRVFDYLASEAADRHSS
jgi:hypothetical protein